MIIPRISPPNITTIEDAMESNSDPKCYQCGAPPFYQVSQAGSQRLLCLACHELYQRQVSRQLDWAARTANYAGNMMWHMAGLGERPSFDVPAPPLFQDNSAHIQGSKVGVVQTGGSIGEVGDVRVDSSGASAHLLQALEALRQAVIREQVLADQDRNAALELLAAIRENAVAAQPRKTVITALFGTLTKTVECCADLAPMVERLMPIIAQLGN